VPAVAETATLTIYDRLAAVRDVPLNSNAKLLLIVLVSYADSNGDAWPSNERLTSDLKLSERQVRRLLTELRHAKLVSTWMEGKQRKLRIDFQQLRALRPAADAMGDTDVPHASRRGTPMSGHGGHPCPPEHTKELSNSLKRERTTRKGDTDVTNPPAAKKQQRLVADQLDQLIAAWNQLPDGIAPRCTKRSESLVRLWKSATRHADVAAALNDVPKLVAAILESSFLHGKGWFKFSWLFGKDRSGEWNAVKIVENNYRDNTNAKPKSAARWQGDASDFDHLATGTPSVAAPSADGELVTRSA
jgi:hypothetical protein